MPYQCLNGLFRMLLLVAVYISMKMFVPQCHT